MYIKYRPLTTFSRFVSTTLATLLLVGCGGGGSSPQQTTVSTAIIDDANALLVARQAYQTSEGVRKSINVFSILLAAPLSGGQQSGGQVVYNVACLNGGSLQVSSTTDVNGVLETGEVFDLVAANCGDATGVAINGSLQLTVTSRPSPAQIGLSVVFNDTNVTERMNSAILMGAISLDINLLTGVVTLTNTTLSYTVLGVASQYNNVNHQFTKPPTSTSTAVTYNATLLTILTINQPLSISTPTAFNFEDGEANPSIGTMRVEAPDGSFLELDANSGDPNTVNLTINSGSATTSSVVQWTTINP